MDEKYLKETETGKNLRIEKEGIKFGLINTGLLIAYFILMAIAGLQYQVEFRYLNYLILIAILAIAFNKFKHNSPAFTYYRGMSLGFVISLTTALSFTLFIVIYMLFIDAQLMKAVQQDSIVGNISPVMITVLTFIELLTGGFISSFILMQFFKPKIDSHHTS